MLRRTLLGVDLLRLLLRCQRIRLQDATYQLHHRQNSEILESNVFKLAMFMDFRKAMGDALIQPDVNPLEQYREVVPVVTEGLQTLSRTSHQSLQGIRQLLLGQQQDNRQIQQQLLEVLGTWQQHQQQATMYQCQPQQRLYIPKVPKRRNNFFRCCTLQDLNGHHSPHGHSNRRRNSCGHRSLHCTN
ncbi:hypothetical protein BG011_007322 [Mortierella polycephala]|uniref:Uncharacterized protein n=1 Tax=Mortierella polycephala TaxID=41804 RepID=A0A9P6QAB8_9FUNG|nr:hypothetical protein BG011_007322 [Mortierella polycephala]